MKIKAISPEIKVEYEKQIRRIKRFVRAAQKRGYDFPESVIPKHPKVVTEASVRKVSAIRPDTLYKKASYTTDTGETVAGLEGRAIERHKAAVKGVETKAAKQGISRPEVKVKPKPSRKKAGKKSPKRPAQKTPRERHFAKSDRKPAKSGAHTNREKVVISHVLETLEEMIRTWQPEPHWTEPLKVVKERDKNTAKNLLQNAIDQLGREQVAKNCEAKASLIISKLEEILYASGSKEGNFRDGRTRVNFDIIEFQNMLLGRRTTAEENVYLADLMERMLYEDVGDDETQFRAGYTATLPKKGKTTKYSPDSSEAGRYYQALTYDFDEDGEDE